MADSTLIVFDVGGTTSRVAALEDGTIGEPEKFATPRDPNLGLSAIVAAARRAAAGRRIEAVCGGAAGIIVGGAIYRSPNLPEWSGTPLANRVASELKAPTTVMNDASLGGLGEFHYGVGKSANIMAYVTVSTGVGGARIVEGTIDRSTYGFEIGHSLVGGVELERLVSGTAAAQRFGKDPKELGKKELGELADTLAVGLYNMTLHWSPDTIVLGGSMITGKNPIPLARVEASLKEHLAKYYPAAPAVKKASLERIGGLYGAMAFLITTKA